MLNIDHLLSEKTWSANCIEKTAVAEIDSRLCNMALALNRDAAEPYEHRGAQDSFLHESRLDRDNTPSKGLRPQSDERREHECKSVLVGVSVVSQLRRNATDNHLRPHDGMGLHRNQCFPYLILRAYSTCKSQRRTDNRYWLVYKAGFEDGREAQSSAFLRAPFDLLSPSYPTSPCVHLRQLQKR